jgi:glucokinase
MKALAIDLGGSHVTCAIVEEDKIVASESLHVEKAASLKDLLPNISETFIKLSNHTSIPFKECAGVAFGFCGLVDVRQGTVISTNAKYADAPTLDLESWATESFSLPLKLENDARLALLGEHYAGAARGFDDIVMMTFGTGIGGVAMIEGKLLYGKHYQAGCLGGHFPIKLNGRRCSCGNIGCVEAEASTSSLPDIASSWPNFQESSLSREGKIDFAKLIAAVREEDKIAREILDHCLLVWATGAIALVHAYDPELIVLGGGVMQSADLIVPFISSYVNEHAWTPWGKVEVRAAELGTNASLLGAVPVLKR